MTSRWSGVLFCWGNLKGSLSAAILNDILVGRMDISLSFGWINLLDHIIEPFDHLENDPDPYCGRFRLRAFPSPGRSTTARTPVEKVPSREGP